MPLPNQQQSWAHINNPFPIPDIPQDIFGNGSANLAHDEKWRKVEFDQSAIGVLMSTSYQRELIEHGLLSYSAAQALRWWFHAQAEIECVDGAPGLQTRLVQHRVTYTNEVKAIGVVNEESQ